MELDVIVGPSPLEGFGVTVSFAGDQAVLGIRGEVDLTTAPELEAVVNAVIDRGHGSISLDLVELGFMDASGLGVIAEAAGRLASSGGGITICSAPALVIQILEITGLDELVNLESTQPAPEHLGPQQSGSDTGAPLTVDAGLVGHLRHVTAIPADTDVVDGALRLVVALARATVQGADGVSVSLHRHGQLTTVAATDQTISDMDADQYRTGEGPCVDASVQGRWFHSESLEEETRWPVFTPEARKLGINAILSSPLVVGDRPVGALNIYSRAAAAFATKEQALAAIFASEASVILRDAGADLSDEALAGRLDEALRSRAVIAQAQGVIMGRQGISPDDAYNTLRRSSVDGERSLREQAEDIVASARRSPSDGSRIPSGGLTHG